MMMARIRPTYPKRVARARSSIKGNLYGTTFAGRGFGNGGDGTAYELSLFDRADRRIRGG